MRFFWLLLLALGLGTKRHWHILIAIVLGIILGLNISGPEYQPLYDLFETIGQIFLRLISMLVIPLVISSLFIGVTSVSDKQQLGRLSAKTLTWFIFLLVLSSATGLLLGNLIPPGETLQAALKNPNEQLQGLLSQVPPIAPVEATPDVKSFILSLIPANPLESLVKMELVPVVLFTLLFGMGVASIKSAGRPLVQFFEAVFAATMKLTDWVLVLAVPGVFSLTFITVAKAGPQIFQLLAPYGLLVLLGLLVQVFILFPVLLQVFARVNFVTLYRAISEALMVAFGTASSSATLPVSMACCERRAGISNRVASFVLPTAASINKTGTAMFEVIAVLFLAQAYDIHLGPMSLAFIAIFAVLASIGTPGVPSAGLITLTIVINSIGEDLTPLFGGLALLWPLDRVLDMARTTVNVIASCTVAALVGASEGEINRDILNNSEQWDEVVTR